MGQLKVEPFIQWLERAGRPNKHSLRARSKSLRLKFRLRCGYRGESSARSQSALKLTARSSVPRRPIPWSGIKPTLGLISRAGIIPIARTRQDTAGPMCRTVTDAAILLGALTGVDARDTATSASQGKALTNYTKFLDPNGLKGARLGIVRKSFGFNDAVDKF